MTPVGSRQDIHSTRLPITMGRPETTTTTNKSIAHSNMVAEQVLTCGLVERTAWLLFVNFSVMTAGCARTVFGLSALGPDEVIAGGSGEKRF